MLIERSYHEAQKAFQVFQNFLCLGYHAVNLQHHLKHLKIPITLKSVWGPPPFSLRNAFSSATNHRQFGPRCCRDGRNGRILLRNHFAEEGSVCVCFRFDAVSSRFILAVLQSIIPSTGPQRDKRWVFSLLRDTVIYGSNLISCKV